MSRRGTRRDRSDFHDTQALWRLYKRPAQMATGDTTVGFGLGSARTTRDAGRPASVTTAASKLRPHNGVGAMARVRAAASLAPVETNGAQAAASHRRATWATRRRARPTPTPTPNKAR